MDLEYYQPDLTELERLISICPDASVKLAPATAVPERWRESAELEWIGYARECKQQIAWFGRLARHPGRRTVTICPRGDFKVRTILENPEARAITTDHFGKFLFVLHSAVVAARLVGTLAEQHSLALVQGSADLLTGERLALDQALTSFEAVAECPFDPKRVGSLLRELEIAPQTVRTSGCRINMAKLTAKLPTSGRKRGGLFVRGEGSDRRVTIAVQRD